MQMGFVGAGRMGAPMVGRLLAAGHDVRVHHRADSSREAPAGAVTTPLVAGAAAGARAVVVNVHSDDQLRDVCGGQGLIEALEPGGVLVVHTTSSPRTARGLAARCAERGVGFVDAAISGGPHDIAAGRLSLFVGGSEDSFGLACDVLATYGDPVMHVGPAGTGMAVKLLNNAAFGAHIGVLAIIAELAGELGLEEAVLLRAMGQGSGNSAVLGMAARRGSVQEFSASTAEFVDKDVQVAAALLGELGSGLGRLEPLYRAMRECRSSGSSPRPAS